MTNLEDLAMMLAIASPTSIDLADLIAEAKQAKTELDAEYYVKALRPTCWMALVQSTAATAAARSDAPRAR